MSMKSLLLGAAAGLTAIGAAQAADLPMTKGEAVEYVKVCSAFGPGFFYIPGTDTCLQIAGEIRADYRVQDYSTKVTRTGFYHDEDGVLRREVISHYKYDLDRDDDRTRFDTQARLKFDARTQTEYGLLRSYIQLNINGYTSSEGKADFQVDKAFLQFGGLTAGYAHTFFGYYDNAYGDTIWASYYGSSGNTVNLIAYTADFGGGITATAALEDGKKHRVGGYLSGGNTYPDLVANVAVDQSWGIAQISGAIHNNRASEAEHFYGADDKWGYAVGGTLGVKFPEFIDGGHFIVEGVYSSGALDYLGVGAGYDTYQGYNNSVSTGKGWAVVAELGGNLTPTLNANLVASYGQVKLDDFIYVKPKYQVYTIAGNLTYTIVKGLTVAGEVAYTHQKGEDFGPDYEGYYFTKDTVTTNSWFGGIRLKRTF